MVRAQHVNGGLRGGSGPLIESVSTLGNSICGSRADAVAAELVGGMSGGEESADRSLPMSWERAAGLRVDAELSSTYGAVGELCSSSSPVI